MSVTITAADYAVHDEFGFISSSIKDSPEANLANGNFRTLWSALGLEAGDALIGEISTQELAKALSQADLALVCRAAHDSKEEGLPGVHVIDFGIDEQRAARYMVALEKILSFAIAHEGFISWG